MVVDTSALAAILLEEPDAVRFGRAITNSPSAIMSAASYVEFGMLVLSRRGFEVRELDAALRHWAVEVVPVSPAQARRAVEAFARYGKGRGHPAQLNFGDCFAYALAVERGEPLLFKGEDFARTDVESAL